MTQLEAHCLALEWSALHLDAGLAGGDFCLGKGYGEATWSKEDFEQVRKELQSLKDSLDRQATSMRWVLSGRFRADQKNVVPLLKAR